MAQKLARLAVLPICMAAAVGANASISDDVVKIGILTDLSGPYSNFGGKGSVVAANLAIEDCLKAECKGMKIEVLSGITAEDRVVLNPPDGLEEGDTLAVVEKPATKAK